MISIYKKLGVKTFINAAGTYTILGGSRMSKKTLDDMTNAAQYHVEIRELQQTIHHKIAEITNNEAAYISNGAASGIYLAIAACISLKKKKPFHYIHQEEIKKLEVITNRAHRTPYDRGILDTGVQLVEIGYPNIILPASEVELRNSITPNTVAIFHVEGGSGGWQPSGGLALESSIKIAKEFNIPIIVDAAAQLPPKENLWKFTKKGADVVLFSGGKDICGPQSSGLILGAKKIINLITDLGFPNYSIGRMMKVGREEIVGLYSAIKQYIDHDEEQRLQWCENQINILQSSLSTSKLFVIERHFPNEAGQPIPRGFVRLYDNSKITTQKLCKLLISKDPAIYVGCEGSEGIYINPMTLKDGEIQTICEQLIEIEKIIIKS